MIESFLKFFFYTVVFVSMVLAVPVAINVVVGILIMTFGIGLAITIPFVKLIAIGLLFFLCLYVLAGLFSCIGDVWKGTTK